MTIKEAMELKKGDKVKQKMHGYILTVQSIHETRNIFNSKVYIKVECKTDNGQIMMHNHKELIKI